MDQQEQPTEMLIAAMRAQKRAARMMELMSAAAHDPRDRELLRTIRREERRHYYFLEGIYEELTGEAVQIQRSALAMPRYYPDMLRSAICDKLDMIDHLQAILAALRCVRQKELLELIISDQQEQARIMASIFSRCH